MFGTISATGWSARRSAVAERNGQVDRRTRAFNAAQLSLLDTLFIRSALKELVLRHIHSDQSEPRMNLHRKGAATRAAQRIVLDSPFRAEIERLEPSALERATAVVTDALRPWDGKHAKMSAHIATATR